MIMNTKQLNMTNKFILLEQLWDDLSQNVEDDRFTPNWHLEIGQNRTMEPNATSDLSGLSKHPVHQLQVKVDLKFFVAFFPNVQKAYYF